MHPKVDDYISNNSSWQMELKMLRQILLDTDLEEMWKWKQPCYSLNDKNVVILGSLKDCCVISFFKGSLMKDPKSILVIPGENTQAARYIKITSVKEVSKLKSTIQSYINEAIALERSGLKVLLKDNAQIALVDEFASALKESPKLERAFNKLTPGRQRGYNLHFSSGKQSKTRMARIEKCIPKILMGYGFHDCTCGQSKRMPTCDGSHKLLIKE